MAKEKSMNGNHFSDIWQHCLKVSNMLSLKMIDFCATHLDEQTPNASSTLPTRQLLAKLLLVALTEVQFHMDYRAILSDRRAFAQCLGVLVFSMERGGGDEMAAGAAIQLAAAIVHAVQGRNQQI